MKIKDKEKPIGIKERIFALIGLDMILPTNFIYREIFNEPPSKDWVVIEFWDTFLLLFSSTKSFYFDRYIDGTYYWMWAFIIIAYFIFTYKTEGGELSKNRGDTS